MPAAANKTQKTDNSVDAFVNQVADPQKRADTQTVIALMQKATKQPPKLWGTAIIGFGDAHYVYDTGREGDWFWIGLSPRAANLTLYAIGGWPRYEALLAKLGKHSLGKGCLYIKRLSDVDPKVLKQLIEAAAKFSKEDAQRQERVSTHAETKRAKAGKK
jgi:hypothetical protein